MKMCLICEVWRENIMERIIEGKNASFICLILEDICLIFFMMCMKIVNHNNLEKAYSKHMKKGYAVYSIEGVCVCWLC